MSNVISRVIVTTACLPIVLGSRGLRNSFAIISGLTDSDLTCDLDLGVDIECQKGHQGRKVYTNW